MILISSDLRLTYVKCVQWKYPRATGFFFFSIISLITAFRFINVLRYVFKAAYLLFACEPHLFLFRWKSRYRDAWCRFNAVHETNLCCDMQLWLSWRLLASLSAQRVSFLQCAPNATTPSREIRLRSCLTNFTICPTFSFLNSKGLCMWRTSSPRVS